MFAASQSPAKSFDDEIFDVDSFGAIQEKIEDVLALLKCGRVVIGDAIGKSDLKVDFQQFAHQVDQIIKHELPLCSAAENKDLKDVYKCVNWFSFHLRFFVQSDSIFKIILNFVSAVYWSMAKNWAITFMSLSRKYLK